jgi:hypothetical protein
MNALLLALLLTADPPRFLGGVEPHPLDTLGPVDERPSVAACSVDTLRESVSCVLDGRALLPKSEGDRQRMAKDNVAVALGLGEALCRERAAALDADGKEQAGRFQGCVTRVRQALKTCSLDGAEALLDADSRFSSLAQACYVGLAAAAQRTSVPDPPAPRPVVPANASSLSEVKQL